jgi:hypothetical protein
MIGGYSMRDDFLGNRRLISFKQMLQSLSPMFSPPEVSEPIKLLPFLRQAQGFPLFLIALFHPRFGFYSSPFPCQMVQQFAWPWQMTSDTDMSISTRTPNSHIRTLFAQSATNSTELRNRSRINTVLAQKTCESTSSIPRIQFVCDRAKRSVPQTFLGLRRNVDCFVCSSD